jgi:hypothetical protein
MRLAAFAHVKQLMEPRDALTASDLAPGFQFQGVPIPLINPQRGIFNADTDMGKRGRLVCSGAEQERSADFSIDIVCYFAPNNR